MYYNTNPIIGSVVTVLIAIVVYAGLTVAALAILYWLIKKAVRTSLNDHYKTVLLYQQSGIWVDGPHPKGPPIGHPDETPDTTP